MDRALDVEYAEPRALLALEKLIVSTSQSYIAVLRKFEVSTDSDIKEAGSLLKTASVDLIAGCELARCGYLKQAYTLWRSWFEQSLFALYFLEAPIHRAAWKVSDSISLADSPQYRLMLHQLLNQTGERHAFALVYNERQSAVRQNLKCGNARKDQVVDRATKVLTLLSQGVHGTFRPTQVESSDKACVQIGAHATPALLNAWSIVSEFWLLFIVNVIDLPTDALIELRNGSLSKDKIQESFAEGADELLTLNEPFKTVFQSIK